MKNAISALNKLPSNASSNDAYIAILSKHATRYQRDGSSYVPEYNCYIHPNDVQYIFNHLEFYEHSEIISALQKLPGYEKNIEEKHKRILRQDSLYDKLSSNACKNIKDSYCAILESKKQTSIEQYKKELPDLVQYADLYQAFIETDNPYGTFTPRIQIRIDAIREMEQGKFDPRYHDMFVSIPTIEFMKKENLDVAVYRMCYGTKLQYYIHQDHLRMLEHCAELPKNAPGYEYKSIIAGCVDASREYNQSGSIKKAMIVADFCWGLIRSAFDGAQIAIEQIVCDPVSTAIGIAGGGHYILGFQIGALLYDVLEIRYAALSEPDKAKNMLHQRYLQPIEQMIVAFNAKEKSLIQVAAEMGISAYVKYKTQKLLCNKLGTFFIQAKNRISKSMSRFKDKYEKVYLATPEGVAIESSRKFLEQEQMKRNHFDAMNTQNPGGSGGKKSKGKSNKRWVPPTGGLHTFTSEQIEAGVKHVMGKENSLHHIYGNNDHGLQFLVDRYGKEGVLRKVIDALSGKIHFDGVFDDVPIFIDGHEIWTREIVMKGMPILSTFFIP